jgi:hypothetical protein
VKLSTLLKGLCIALLPNDVSILVAYWAMTRRKK